MFTASVVHWHAFKHNKEAGNGLCETLNAHDLQLLAITDCTVERDFDCRRCIVAHI